MTSGNSILQVARGTPRCRKCARTPYSSWEFGVTRALLAVRVAVSPTSWYPPSAALPGAGRPPDFDPADSALTELGIEPADQHRREQPDLGGPRGRVGRDHELAPGEAVWAGVGGEVGPDDLGPVTKHRTHRCLFLPALIRQQAADRGRQRLRVV